MEDPKPQPIDRCDECGEATFQLHEADDGSMLCDLCLADREWEDGEDGE